MPEDRRSQSRRESDKKDGSTGIKSKGSKHNLEIGIGVFAVVALGVFLYARSKSSSSANIPTEVGIPGPAGAPGLSIRGPVGPRGATGKQGAPGPGGKNKTTVTPKGGKSAGPTGKTGSIAKTTASTTALSGGPTFVSVRSSAPAATAIHAGKAGLNGSTAGSKVTYTRRPSIRPAPKTLRPYA